MTAEKDRLLQSGDGSELRPADRVWRFLEAWDRKTDVGDQIYGVAVFVDEDAPRDLLASDLRELLRRAVHLCDGCNSRHGANYFEHRCCANDGAWRGDPPCECPEPDCRERQARSR